MSGVRVKVVRHVIHASHAACVVVANASDEGVWVKVARIRVRTTNARGVFTRTVVGCGLRVIVARSRIGASQHKATREVAFAFFPIVASVGVVANGVVHKAEARFKVTTSWEVIVCPWVVVARKWKDAASYQGEVTGAVVLRGGRIVIDGLRIRATIDFKFVTNPISVRVIQTCALAIGERRGRIGAAVVLGHRSIAVVVASLGVHAACAAREVTQADVQVFARRIVVASARDDAACDQARTVIVGCVGVVAGVAWICAACDFIFIANAVLVRVIQAHTVAVQPIVWVLAAVVVQGCVWVVVACRCIGTSHTAREFTIRVHKVFGARIVVASERQGTAANQTASVVVRSEGIVARIRRVRTAADFVFVTHAVAVCVVQADAVTVVTFCSVVTAAIVLSGVTVVVARFSIRTSSTAREVAEAKDLVIRFWRVVARTRNQTSTHQTAAVFHSCVGVVARVGGVRTSRHFEDVADAVVVDVFQTFAVAAITRLRVST